MAYDRKKTSYDVRPMENTDGTLEGIRIQRTERIARVAEDGRVLDRGDIIEVGDALELPLSRVGEVLKDINEWMTYYASGEAARDGREPVSWPNSRETVTE